MSAAASLCAWARVQGSSLLYKRMSLLAARQTEFYTLPAAIIIHKSILHDCSCRIRGDMNLEFADQALDSFINADIDWMQHFYPGKAKLPEPCQWSNTINDEVEMEMELSHIINAANKRSRIMAAAPAINTSAIGSWDLAAAAKGSWKPDRDLCWNSALRVNSFGAAAVPLSSCGLITKNAAAAMDTSALQEYPSAFRNDPPPPPPMEAAGASCRGSAPLKPKRKRVRPSRRAPTTVVKTDTSNFKALVQHFTGIPHTSSITTQESTTPPSESSLPDSSSSATSPSFSKPLPHPALCKTSSSSRGNAKTTCASPPLCSSFPARQSLPELPSRSTVVSLTGSDQISNSADTEDQINLPDLIDVAFFEKLWNEINIEPMGTNL